MGPVLVTGAAVDDPSGLATQKSSQSAVRLQASWTMLFSFSLMSVFQKVCARIGAVTKVGIAHNLRRHYFLLFLQFVLCCPTLACRHVINLVADLGAMGERIAEP